MYVSVTRLLCFYPPGAAGGGAEALRECRTPTRRAVVRRVQTRPQLAEENGRNLS